MNQISHRPAENYFKIDSFNVDTETIPETEVNITLFSNRVFVIITQLNKLGTMVSIFLNFSLNIYRLVENLRTQMQMISLKRVLKLKPSLDHQKDNHMKYIADLSWNFSIIKQVLLLNSKKLESELLITNLLI